MRRTTYYSLKMPDLTDTANIEDLNDNSSIIDTTLKSISDTANNAAPKTRKVNGKALSSDITLAHGDYSTGEAARLTYTVVS